MSETKDPNFKKEVLKRLIDMDMNISDLAAVMGISSVYLGDLLNGNRGSEERLKQIRERLQMETETVYRRD